MTSAELEGARGPLVIHVAMLGEALGEIVRKPPRFRPHGARAHSRPKADVSLTTPRGAGARLASMKPTPNPRRPAKSIGAWLVLEGDAALVMRNPGRLWDELVLRWQQRWNSV